MGFLERSSRQFVELWSASSELRGGGPPDGWLQKRALTGRIISAVLLLLAVMTTHNLLMLVLIYFLCACAALTSRLDLNRYLLHNLALVALFVLPLTIFGSLQAVSPGNVFLRIGPVAFSRQGALSVAFVALRALCALSVTMLLLRSAGIQGLFRGFREAGIPAGVVAALHIAVIHIHVLARTAEAMVKSLSARVMNRLTFRRAYSCVAVQGAVLLQKSMASSHNVHASMLARGFEGTFPSIHDRAHLSARDFLLIGACAAILIAGFVW